MDKTQHTPGPWHPKGVIRPQEQPLDIVGGISLVAIVPAQPTLGKRAANALLIAAAPELLAALEACERSLASYAEENGDGDLDECKAARAAIAKATGVA